MNPTLTLLTLLLPSALLALPTTSLPPSNDDLSHPSSTYPATTNVYNQLSGGIDYDSEFGYISRGYAGPELSTLSGFYFFPGGEHVGKTCKFNFEFDSEGRHALLRADGGYPEFDVFKSAAVLEGDVEGTGWGAPTNQRREQLGRMRVVDGGQAEPVWGNFEFACPEPSTDKVYYWEVVPTGEKANMQWSKKDGPWISWN